MLTFKDLTEKLKQVDEITLMEALEISSEDLVDRFEDHIEMKFDKLCLEFDDTETEEDENS